MNFFTKLDAIEALNMTLLHQQEIEIKSKDLSEYIKRCDDAIMIAATCGVTATSVVIIERDDHYIMDYLRHDLEMRGFHTQVKRDTGYVFLGISWGAIEGLSHER